MNQRITEATLRSLKPRAKEYYLRDTTLKGFGVKVYPSGSIKFITETWAHQRSYRRTIGQWPLTGLKEAKSKALETIQQTLSSPGPVRNDKTLGEVFRDYLRSRDLKPNTVRNHKETVEFYLSDWLQRPVADITRQMVERRFITIRDKGMRRLPDGSIRFKGKPTLSQAAKTMRILSALMGYAMADEAISSNPVDVLKQKRINRTLAPKTSYVPGSKVKMLLKATEDDNHPGTLGLLLMLYSGLRKNEALRLKWSDVDSVHGIRCLTISDTKNKRPHYVPVSIAIASVLKRAQEHQRHRAQGQLSAPYVFMSTQKPGAYLSDVRPSLRRMATLIDHEFTCHDLRRTFATRGAEVGLDFLMLKRLLNHKSNDITGQYIQWNSKQNLLVMRDALERVIY